MELLYTTIDCYRRLGSGDFMSLSEMEEEAARCRRLAAEAKQIAAEKSDPIVKEFYLDIERQWLSLAEAYDERAALERPKST